MIGRQDLIAFSAMLFVTLGTWLSVAMSGPFSSVLAYWDGPNYLYAGVTLYNIPPYNPWTRNFNYPPSYFACHLPGYPLLIRLCSLFCVNNYVLGFHFSILIPGLAFSYSFRRLLIATAAVRDPTFTTILASFIPMRIVIYHSVGASEILLLTFVCLAFIFYRTNSFVPMLLCVWGSCVTRIEGMVIGAVIGFCYLIQFKIRRALGMFLTFAAPLGVVGLHKWRFDDSLAYLHFNQESQHLIGWPPFKELLGLGSDQNEFTAHSFVANYVLFALGCALTLTKSIPIGLFATAFAGYVSLLHHIDIYRYALPGAVFALLVGFDGFWGSDIGKMTCMITLPFYTLLLVIYTKGQIHSNKAWPAFMEELMEQI
jgi:hypothetical protein